MKKLIISLFIVTLTLDVKAQAPADSVGIWAIHNGEATRIEKVTHQAIKGSGGLASMATFGVAKIKSKLVFKNATSPHQFDGTATMRIYFGRPDTQQIPNLYMFMPNYSINNFEIARFEVKKNKRQLTGVSASITGSKVGVNIAEDMEIENKEIRSGVYDLIVKGKPGEYCVMFTANGSGGFGGVFDFTIK